MKFTPQMVLGVAMVLLVFPAPAAAYLDPSTGSIVLQVMVGGLLTVMAAVRLYWKRIRSWIGKKSDVPPPAQG